MPAFTHLHVHSHFTLLESPITIPKLLQSVKAKGMDGVALTDRGNLFGAYEFYDGCKNAQLKGIIGCQVNVTPLGISEKNREMQSLVLLAQDELGYKNLAKLVSIGWLDGFYFEPRIDLSLLAQHAAGLVCLTGAGSYGFLNRHLTNNPEEAARQLGSLTDIFGKERLFVEITDHLIEGSRQLVDGNVGLAREYGLGIVATNWVHYLESTDAPIHDVQLTIQKATTIDDARRKRMPSQEFWLKTPDEMAQLFKDLPEAISNTQIVAEMCSHSKIPTGKYHLPTFSCPDGLDENAYLRRLSEEGFRQRYQQQVPTGAHERLEFELATITKAGFPGYFLIVADFIRWAKQRGIPVGPGRGSAAGSLVSYSLGITDMCPLRYGLLFERFLNPGRASMPDIDVDFCKDRRGEVIEYVSNKYGHDAVTQIMTLGTMKARMAIKDVARAYHWTPEESQSLANLVPEDPSGKHDLAVCLGRKALNKDKNEFGAVDAMVNRYQEDTKTKQVLDAALQLEKIGRSLGVHACGIIIAPGPVSDYLPVCEIKEKIATQFNMIQVEKCGLLKMDFLGLKTMSILKKAAAIVKETEKIDIDYNQVSLTDAKTFSLLSHGETLGVFQCESTGFQELIKRLKPDRFEDMIALVALYRPGPLMAGMHHQYCDRKNGLEKVDYPHPVLENVLRETFGLYIYQEQVMSISRELCGFTPAEADDLRKAMGKKDINVLKKLEEKFIDGAWNVHQFDREKCKKMWEAILGFASYCFNKSHSACYGLIAYWTAYMKANHFAAFMTANLIYEMDNKDKMTKFVEELRNKNVPVLPPDINESGWEFTLVTGNDGAPAIRFGFGGVKAIGESAAHALITQRSTNGPFDSLYDLCARVDTRAVNKRTVESLIKVGACDSLHPNRHALFNAMDKAFDRGNRLAKNKSEHQQTLFDTFDADDSFRSATQGYDDIADWTESERLAFEKAATGYWISSHPLLEYQSVLTGVATHTAATLLQTASKQTVSIAAVILAKRVIRTKAGKMMAILSLEDQSGRFEGVLFAGGGGRRGNDLSPYDKFAAECEPDLVALFTGSVERRERRAPTPTPLVTADVDADGEVAVPEADEAHAPEAAAEILPSLIIQDCIPARLITERMTKEIHLTMDFAHMTIEDGRRRMADMETLFRENPGPCPVTTVLHTPDDVVLTVALGDNWKVHPHHNVLGRLRAIWGDTAVKSITKNGL